jgi:hypothetical protein
MTKITNTGDGLSIIVACNYLPHHNWMAFASCYSILKNLHDAELNVCCDKSQRTCGELFKWASKMGINFSYEKPKVVGAENLDIVKTPKLPILQFISCDTMAVRDWQNAPDIADAKSNDDCTFVTYREGCGNFELASWIDSLEAPFIKVPQLRTQEMSINEMKVFDLWEKILPIYSMTGW